MLGTSILSLYELLCPQELRIHPWLIFNTISRYFGSSAVSAELNILGFIDNILGSIDVSNSERSQVQAAQLEKIVFAERWLVTPRC